MHSINTTTYLAIFNTSNATHVLSKSCIESPSSECTNSEMVILAICATVHSKIVSRSSISMIKTNIPEMRRSGRNILLEKLIKINSYLGFGRFLMKSVVFCVKIFFLKTVEFFNAIFDVSWNDKNWKIS